MQGPSPSISQMILPHAKQLPISRCSRAIQLHNLLALRTGPLTAFAISAPVFLPI